MRIEGLNAQRREDRARIAATVVWEDCDRPAQNVFFETDLAFEADLVCTPQTFVVACILPAMRHGEKRLLIDEPICPELHNGLKTAMHLICHWYGPPRKPVRIEARAGVHVPASHTEKRTGAFLSGGVDSLAILRRNRLDFSLDHPRSIKDCLFVHGFDVGAFEQHDPELGTFERALATLQVVAKDAQVNLIPVFTNVRHLEDSVDFWMWEFHAAALSSVAHAFSRRFGSVSISSTIEINRLHPWGSHPLLDPNYSSAELQIRHEGLRLSRLDKARLVGDWDVALQNLRPCWTNPLGMLNCGKCEKCVQTMTELLAVGKLSCTQAFPRQDVSKELIASVRSPVKHMDGQWRDLIAPLKEQGRDDLADAIEKKSAEFNKRLAWREERDWKGAVKRFDRRFLRSGLFRSWETLRSHRLKPSLKKVKHR